MPSPSRSEGRRRLLGPALGFALVAFGVALQGQGAAALAPLRAAASLAVSGDAVDAWERRIASMTRAGSLRLVASVEDTMLEGRVHDRLDQFAGAARIVGGQVVRQRVADGVVTVFGTMHPDDLGIPIEPALSDTDALVRVASLTAGQPIARRRPELVVLPLDDGTYRLAWLTLVAIADDVVALYLDAHSGVEVRRHSMLQTQAAVGVGTGVLGDRKKVATRQASGVFFAEDLLRPAKTITYDMKGDYVRARRVILTLSAVSGVYPQQSDVAADTDNAWDDGAVVDAHAGVGIAYDYYRARFNRRGFDGADARPLRVFVHPASRDPLVSFDVFSRFVVNAFFCRICGPDEDGVLVFGEGMDRSGSFNGQFVDYFSAGLDVVAHEYSHAVTSYAANLIYYGESGALNEAFSDIMAIGAEHFAAATGRRSRPGNYLLGEDVFTPVQAGGLHGSRSASHPVAYAQPDHYAGLYRGSADDAGVHINSGIPNHAFYLAIEGGTHAWSGVSVQGVGNGNREQIERTFYRGFTTYLTSNPTFAQARQATLRAAIDLYGESSPAYRATAQAWTAVGVN
jgi:bacillolysin